MGISTNVEWKCDLCGHAEATYHKEIAGWVKLDIEDIYLDRSWHTKVICPGCVQQIEAFVDSRKKKK